MPAHFRSLAVSLAVLLLVACGSEQEPAPAGAPAEEAAAPAATEPAPDASSAPPDMPRGIVLSLAQFQTVDGRPKPGAARLEFLVRRGGTWQATALEDEESNVFHKAMVYDGDDDYLVSLGGTAAIVKVWSKEGGKLTAENIWQKDFGGKFSRMRDAEIADLYGDGNDSIAVATHDQGVVAVLRANEAGSFEVVELDQKPETFVHEIEIGDVDGDGTPEVYATPSEPNRLDGTPQSGEVVRYVPGKGEGRVVVADLGDRHAKEILVDDVDGDGRDELYVSVEGHIAESGGSKRLEHPVEIRRYDADTPPDQGVLVATIDDSLCRFLTAGDVDGDGKNELVAAAFSRGVWLFRPGTDPKAEWKPELVDADSGGFEHASILTDLDGDGKDELYVASDKHKEVRRYVWDGRELVRETIYVRPDDRPIFTWNLMPFPVDLAP